MMNKIEYWLESLNSSLDELGRADALTEKEKKSIAYDLQASHENYSMAFPQPDFRPSKTEKSAQVKRLEEKIASLESDIDAYKNGVAKRRRVPPEDVYIENGDVKYDIIHQW